MKTVGYNGFRLKIIHLVFSDHRNLNDDIIIFIRLRQNNVLGTTINFFCRSLDGEVKLEFFWPLSIRPCFQSSYFMEPRLAWQQNN